MPIRRAGNVNMGRDEIGHGRTGVHGFRYVHYAFHRMRRHNGMVRRWESIRLTCLSLATVLGRRLYYDRL